MDSLSTRFPPRRKTMRLAFFAFSFLLLTLAPRAVFGQG
jgi:hypothetical protein